MASPDPLPGPLQIGQPVGKYEVTGFIAEGGMGIVYSGRHQRLHGQKVAIKVMRTGKRGPAQDKLAQRFFKEAEAAAGIRHDNIVTVHDVDVLDSGEPYMVMAWMPGCDLDNALARGGPLDRGRALRLFWGCLGGLAKAHEAGVVHKDIKPANLFLKHAGTADESLCLLDFGVARLVDEAAVTHDAAPAGTFKYMAPEYYRDVRRVSPRIDVYQMGLTLIEALTGEMPVVGVVRETDNLEIPASLGDQPALLDLLQRATAFDPAARFENADQMRRALGALLPEISEPDPLPGPLPTPKPPPKTAVEPHRHPTAAEAAPKTLPKPPTKPSPPPDAPKKRRRWPTGLLGLAVVLLLGIAGLVAVDRLSEGGSDGAEDRDGMVEIPAGTFQRGSDAGRPNARPVRKIHLDAFWIDLREVTVADYRDCVHDGACTPPKATAEGKFAAYHNWDRQGRDKHPINGVTWQQATDFCDWHHKRLPTEAEWERAARGPNGLAFPWGDAHPGAPGPRRGNFPDASAARVFKEWSWTLEGYDDGYAGTAPVGSFEAGASPEGALDMAGNVWEWTADSYSADYYAQSPDQNPRNTDKTDSRVIRGGSWGYFTDRVTTTFRDHRKPFESDFYIGFRCAR